MSKDIRRSVRCLALAALAVAPVAARADAAPKITTLEPDTLKVCLYAGFKPFVSKDETGAWQGWDVTYLDEFAKEHGFKKNKNDTNDKNKLLHFVPVEQKMFDDIWLRPGQGECDIAATGISDTADRRKATKTTGKVGCWSSTYYGVLRTFLVRTPEYAKLNDVRDLAGRTAIVTKGSTANTDLCYRMRLAGLHPCEKEDRDHPCDFEGLQGFREVTREEDGACVDIEYPQGNDEGNAAIAVANVDQKDPAPPFTYGGGYGSIQTLVCDTPGNNLALVWPHCNMGSDFQAYSEPFSFVVRAKSTGLFEALNEYIAEKQHPYSGTVIPDLGCAVPPWTKPDECKEQ